MDGRWVEGYTNNNRTGTGTTGVSDFKPGTLTQGYSRNVFKPRGLVLARMQGPKDQRAPLTLGGVSWTHLCSPLPITGASWLHAPLHGPLKEGK